MGDLISRKALFDCVYRAYGVEIDGGEGNLFMGWINAAPAVDAAPVARGEWKTEVRGRPDNGGTYGISKCSICGFEQSCAAKGNYCPNCGAKMDKEEARDEA